MFNFTMILQNPGHWKFLWTIWTLNIKFCWSCMLLHNVFEYCSWSKISIFNVNTIWMYTSRHTSGLAPKYPFIFLFRAFTPIPYSMISHASSIRKCLFTHSALIDLLLFMFYSNMISNRFIVFEGFATLITDFIRFHFFIFTYIIKYHSFISTRFIGIHFIFFTNFFCLLNDNGLWFLFHFNI